MRVSTIGRPGAGPGISLSFLLTALACSFAALCYAELASMIPIAGSAYTYAYATLGELIAWIIGWDLILEYAVSNMAVAVGFSGISARRSGEPLRLAPAGASSPCRPLSGDHFTGAWFNVPALIILLVAHLHAGARRARERRDQQRHGGHQDRRHPDLRAGRGAGHQHGQLASLPAQRVFRRAHRRRPSSSSPTSASIRSRRPRRSAGTRSATCPSASS